LLIENKYAVIAAVIGFLLALWLTDGSLMAGFGVLALIAGAAWAVRRLSGHRGRSSGNGREISQMRKRDRRARHGRLVVAASLFGAAAWLALSGPSFALQCPVPQPAGGPGVIQETAADIDNLAIVLASGDLGPQVPLIVNALRTRHPGVPNGEIVNYLVTAYCPVVNRMSGLSESEKHAKLGAFASQVVQVAY
jgi:hypothetical protein